MKTQLSNSEGLSAMPAFVAKCRRTLVTNVEAIRRFAIVSAAAVLLPACASEVDKGICGANPTYCSWSYNDKKELTIKGTGEMKKNPKDLFRNAHYGWDKYKKEMTAVSISGVTVIGEEAFEGYESLTSVSISGVTEIGEDAFQNCTGITKLSLPSSLTTIGSSAFYGCKGLTELSIPKKVTSIGSRAFYGCESLTSVSIGSGVVTIGKYAFKGCESITTLTIPNSVTEIGEEAFDGCTGVTEINIGSGLTTNLYGFVSYKMVNLTAINVDEKNTLFYSVEGVLFARKDEHVVLAWYPNGRQGAYIIPDGITIISGDAFRGATGLTSVTIPSSVGFIGDGAFKNCTALTSIVVPEGVTTIGSYIFQDCTGLTSVSIPKSLTKNGSGVFAGCTNLKERPTLPQNHSRSNTQRSRRW